jgi:primosomal protein N' (replication factor Y) (superfamily II helicase)
MKVARVALDVPIPALFDYVLPQDVEDAFGRRVLVPFGRGRKIGVVLETDAEASIAANRIKSITQVFLDEPALPADVLVLLRFASEYYHHPLGQVVLGALPQLLRRAGSTSQRRPHAFELTDKGRALDRLSLPSRALIKRKVLALLQDVGTVEASVLHALSPSAARILVELERGQFVIRRAVQSHPRGNIVPGANHPVELRIGPELTAQQQLCVNAVVESLDGYSPFLLRGVTGSGKTEVYFHVIAEALRRGQQALVLVPEINLTPQLTERFRARFPATDLIALHSNLAEGERVRGWRAAESGEASVVIGTRLAVFTPLPRLGLIVVDEEHDASFKQQEGLRYSARDLALFRAKQRGVPVLLGSATPSLESYANATERPLSTERNSGVTAASAQRYRLLELGTRSGITLPTVRCVDTRKLPLRHGLAPVLLDAIRSKLEHGEQSLIFVNRRGYAPALVCSACGWASPCTRCSARLVLHLKDGRMRCHYCGHEERVAAVCPSCGNQDLAPAGHGTQRIESALEEVFPHARVLRVDRDSTRRKRAFELMQEAIRAQEVDILVGTQMLAKGHDFPRLTLVGIVNADSALYGADFRAAERLYALLTQVAGRAGRGDLPGEVLIQTEFPEHGLYDAVCRQDYAAFARDALGERRQAQFPPFGFQALLRAEATRREAVDGYLTQAARTGMALGFAAEIFDPVPAVVARVAGRERGQLLVQSASRGELQRFLSAWYPHLTNAASRAVRWSLDVDPLDL